MIIISIILVLFISLIIYGLWVIESKEKMTHAWKVEHLLINQKDFIDSLKLKSMSFYDDGKMLTPFFYWYEMKSPLNYQTWHHQRINIFEGQIVITDTVQNVFSGIYDIEYIDHTEPQLIRLYSDSIDIYLRRYGRFSLENQTIQVD